MIPVDLKRHPRLSEGLIQSALADYVQWWRVVAVPNLCLFHEMDFAVLTRAGCLWEYEIKLSQADWERDREKDVAATAPPWVDQMPDPDSWRLSYERPRRNLDFVERFHYVFPPKLTVPEWVPEWAGLLTVDYLTIDGRLYLQVRHVRAAKARKAKKPDERQVRKLYEAIYHRYWRQLRALPPGDAVDHIIASEVVGASAPRPEGE